MKIRTPKIERNFGPPMELSRPVQVGSRSPLSWRKRARGVQCLICGDLMAFWRRPGRFRTRRGKTNEQLSRGWQQTAGDPLSADYVGNTTKGKDQ
jgi:hypothetical protein